MSMSAARAGRVVIVGVVDLLGALRIHVRRLADLDDGRTEAAVPPDQRPAQFVRDEAVEGCRSSLDPLSAEYLASL
jgi:hypothetical protein